MAKKKEVQEEIKQKQEAEKAPAKEKSNGADKVLKALQKEKEDLTKENETLKAEVSQMKEVAQRVQAEFDNYRRRSLNDNELSRFKGASSIVNAILPALDSVDEAVRVYSSDEGKKELLEGFLQINKQLINSLASAGVEPMDCEGKEFDPNLHEAIMMQECEGVDSGIIINVFRKGYTFKDAVIRHAQVIVAK